MLQMDKNVLSNFINVGGIRTHFVEAGQGEPIILVHGAGPGAFGWGGWRQTIPALAPHFHVYALDTLGFGFTDKPTNIVYSDQASVDHLAGFIDALCLDKVNLLGNSRGAYMCAKYTCDHPDRVKRLLMISSGSSCIRRWASRGRRNRRRGSARLQGYDGTPEAMRRFMERIVHDHSKITDELIAVRVEMAALPGHDYVPQVAAANTAIQLARRSQRAAALRAHAPAADADNSHAHGLGRQGPLRAAGIRRQTACAPAQC